VCFPFLQGYLYCFLHPLSFVQIFFWFYFSLVYCPKVSEYSQFPIKAYKHSNFWIVKLCCWMTYKEFAHWFELVGVLRRLVIKNLLAKVKYEPALYCSWKWEYWLWTLFFQNVVLNGRFGRSFVICGTFTKVNEINQWYDTSASVGGVSKIYIVK